MEEKRKSKRYSVILTGAYTFGGAQPDAHCVIVELSREGLRIKSKEKIPFGSTVALAVSCPSIPESVRIPVIIRWSKQLYDDPEFEWLAGGEFGSIDAEIREKLISYVQS